MGYVAAHTDSTGMMPVATARGKSRILRSIGLGVATAALSAMAGFLTLLIYIEIAYEWQFLIPKDCGWGASTGWWTAGSWVWGWVLIPGGATLVGMLPALTGLAYVGARARRLNPWFTIPVAGILAAMLVVPVLIVGAILIPDAAGYVDALSCYD